MNLERAKKIKLKQKKILRFQFIKRDSTVKVE